MPDIKIIESYDKIYKSIINKEPLEESRVISKDSIPNLLNKIMFIIPGNVQLTKIKNTENNHIEIEAISENIGDLETFYNSIQTDGEIMTNMKVNYINRNNIIIMTIEGDII